MRVGLSLDMGGAPVDPEVRAAVHRAALAFEGMGASVEEAKVELDHQRAKETFSAIFYSDYAAGFGETYLKQREMVTPSFQKVMDEAVGWPASELAKALRELEWHRFRMDALIRRYDVLLTPTLAVTAFPVGQRPGVIDGRAVDPDWGFTPFTYLVNMSGHPAASIPCGFSQAGLPIGLHVIGQRGDEATVLRACAAYEEAWPWGDMRPEGGVTAPPALHGARRPHPP